MRHWVIMLCAAGLMGSAAVAGTAMAPAQPAGPLLWWAGFTPDVKPEPVVVAPQPVTPGPVTPDPVTPGPVTPDPVTPAADPATTSGPEAPPPAPTITFTTPVPEGDPWVVGRSLEELIKGEPHFPPPVEGLPDEAWKGHHCSDCHQWKQDNLCEAARSLSTAKAEISTQKEHPLGLRFKETLRAWGAAGCP